MSALKFIMDTEDDGDPGNDKYSSQPNPSRSALGPNPSSASPTTSTTKKSDDNLHPPNTGLSKAHTKRRGPLNRSSRATATTSSSNTAATSAERPTSSTSLSPSSRSPLLEKSTADSTESMDSLGYANYGHRSSLSTMSPTSRSNMSSRPISNAAGESNIPVKLTPVTKRVSRAKKGVPVHICEKCNPRKTFTRAEHLRRHQLSHQPPVHECPYPGCDRAFHRQDLLTRHTQRHEQEDKSGTDGIAPTSRRPSRPPVEGPPIDFLPRSMIHDNMVNKISSNTPYAGDTSQYQATGHGGSSTGQGAMSPSSQSQRSHSVDASSGYSWSSGHEFPPPSIMEDSPFNNPSYSIEYQQPRTIPMGGLHGLHNLQIPDITIPGRLHQESNWPSSASNSPYSTPTPEGPIIPGFDPVSQQSQYSSPQPPLYPLGFTTPFPEDSSALYDLHAHAFSVRSLTPPTVTLSAQTAENIVTFGHSVSGHPTVRGRRKISAALLSPYSGAVFPAAQALKPAQLNAIPRYLDVYWKRFDTFFPLVHRWILENPADDLLRCAMAAVGSQFLQSEEDRTNGELLYDFVHREFQLRLQWSLETMQAILLCEFYGRFRGLKPIVRPSQPFQSLYSRDLFSLVLSSSSQPSHLYSTSSLQMASPQPLDNCVTSIDASHQTWEEWIVAESRRRLLAACFVLDVHLSVYYELSPLHDLLNSTAPIPLTRLSQHLWEAQDPNSWEALIRSEPSLLNSMSLGDEEITPDLVATAPPLDAAIYLASETLRLPRRPHPSTLGATAQLDLDSVERICFLFPTLPIANTYLALHFTPLHDLLAVSGDTWRFAKKMLKPDEFKQGKISVRSWSSSVHAGAASIFAAKALLAFLDTNDNDTLNNQSQTENWQRGSEWNRSNISDYWALYVCTLVCWALAHRPMRAAGSSSANYNIVSNLAAGGDNQVEQEAKGWLKMVASLNPEAVMQNVRGRRKVLGVISMVRKRLEDEAVGCKSKLLVDSVRVLKNLEGESNRARF